MRDFCAVDPVVYCNVMVRSQYLLIRHYNKLFRLLLSYIQQSTQNCLHGSLKYFSRDIFHDFKYFYRTPQVQPLS